LLDRASLAMHVPLESLPAEKYRLISDLYANNAVLAGKSVLVVDDDIRNIFALSSVLERRGMEVLTAGTGFEAIEMLENTPGVAIVLMDVMMPEMDGLDTTRVIRKNERFRDLPIIAVTAKAMRGDREKCIEAGAWDYLSKPVDPEELLAMLRAWLIR
jgi:CheY-like chemotaxis protein